MFGSKIFAAIFGRSRRPGGARAKPSWGRQSSIDLLADGLAKSPEGWLAGPNTIRRNGVEISWSGPLTTSLTAIRVVMDGKKYPVLAAEAPKLKKAVIDLLRKIDRAEAAPASGRRS